ncbi:sensor histidine kinase [Actinomadura alba]|nr:sensor histidine kinase [Actinomadura alba]
MLKNGSQDPAGLRLLLPAITTVLPTGLLRRRPLPALALMLAGSFAATTTVHSWEVGYLQVLANDVAVGFIVATRPRRIWIVAAVMALSVQIGSATYYTSGSDFFGRTVAFLVMAIITAWMIGHSIRERREHSAALRSQAAAQAVTAERLRIARELHDIIAHSVGIIAIQAGVGSRVMDTQPAEARNALTAIEATSRETLAGLRRTVGALRRTEPGPGPGSAPLDPAPGLADVDRLVASTMDAGVRVEVRWRGKRRPLPDDIDLAAFRIIQEAVTNVVRHAGTPDCRVTIDHGDTELLIEIDDDGQGGGSVTGYGIVGMRERAGLLGGRFSAGPRPEGGFRVAARLPLPSERR